MAQRWGEIFFKLIPKIQAERPELVNKLQKMQTMPLEEVLAKLSEASFPNR
jgi:hypothetical protein